MSSRLFSSSRQKSSFKSITPLYEACRDGNEEQVRNLLPKYSHRDLNRQEYPYGGNTCLHVAAANGHDSIVALLLKHGCYRSLFLNSQYQSAYDIAASTKESTRSLFLRKDENDPSLKSSTRFYEQNGSECFDIVKVDDQQEGKWRKDLLY
jgi:ankyrin repeat protein